MTGEILEQATVGVAQRFAVGAGAEDERPHPLAGGKAPQNAQVVVYLGAFKAG